MAGAAGPLGPPGGLTGGAGASLPVWRRRGLNGGDGGAGSVAVTLSGTGGAGSCTAGRAGRRRRIRAGCDAPRPSTGPSGRSECGGRPRSGWPPSSATRRGGMRRVQCGRPGQRGAEQPQDGGGEPLVVDKGGVRRRGDRVLGRGGFEKGGGATARLREIGQQPDRRQRGVCGPVAGGQVGRRTQAGRQEEVGRVPTEDRCQRAQLVVEGSRMCHGIACRPAGSGRPRRASRAATASVGDIGSGYGLLRVG